MSTHLIARMTERQRAMAAVKLLTRIRLEDPALYAQIQDFAVRKDAGNSLRAEIAEARQEPLRAFIGSGRAIETHVHRDERELVNGGAVPAL